MTLVSTFPRDAPTIESTHQKIATPTSYPLTTSSFGPKHEQGLEDLNARIRYRQNIVKRHERAVRTIMRLGRPASEVTAVKISINPMAIATAGGLPVMRTGTPA